MGLCLAHIRTIFKPFLPYICFKKAKTDQTFTEKPCITNRRVPHNDEFWDLIGANFGLCLGQVFALKFLKWFIFSMNNLVGPSEQYNIILKDETI